MFIYTNISQRSVNQVIKCLGGNHCRIYLHYAQTSTRLDSILAVHQQVDQMALIKFAQDEQLRNT